MTEHPNSDALVARIAALDVWATCVDPKPLLADITNKIFIARDGARTCVVRTGDDISVHGILRANELAAGCAAHKVGISPGVI
ncbi:MAG: hypothetical protein K2X41_04790 [Hyphomicrobium sp.]|nr:hypothetical protein [Hyphomicrobium sp.]